MRVITHGVVALALLAASAGCNGGNDVTTSSSGPSGQWQMSITHGVDSCSGTSDPPEVFDVAVSTSGSAVTMKLSGHPCDQVPPLTLSGSLATWAQTGDNTSGTCTTQEDISTTITFSKNTFTGQTQYKTQYISGDCTGTPLPCTRTDTLSGVRCSGCYTGCL